MILDNQTVGKNISLFRKLRQKKAFEVAFHLGLKEAAYTKYERGETKITIDFIQNISEFLKVDPLHLLVSNPEQLLENLYQSSSNSSFKLDLSKIEDHNKTLNQILQSILTLNESIKEILIANK
ncbi:Helix-turn-helix protein [Belliella baltica DSM 15883]|uniref:Helix-turn-helix protein n=1 Tax=Belliella baltica (strain DSM 15883 / CIP 108006 / LMG 21964 / BA134) TaxID=866536 RepID=I3Z1M8_BELBD|nr:helix-turn-helix transcriptional regulator [Belliella baltica]AFL83146.1 Helix-turn-helix protein [Belliella baltica DSM 15883]